METMAYFYGLFVGYKMADEAERVRRFEAKAPATLLQFPVKSKEATPKRSSLKK